MNIELFPCSGGMAEGFRRAGVTFDLAFDKDPDACNSYEHNHCHRPIQLDVNDLGRMVAAGWASSPIDLLVADPPCTPWSRAGKRAGTNDPRDCLKVTAELIRVLRPRAYLIGNVPGLQDSTSWHVVQDVIGGLAQHGYCVVDYASLDAADYGVPQHRIRPFWFGHLDGPCIRWPAPTHGAPNAQLELGPALKPWVTCRQALGHLELEQLGRPIRMRIRPTGEDGRKNGGDDTRCSATDRPAATVVAKDTRKGGQILLGNSKHPTNTLDRPSMAVTTKGDGRGAQGTCALRIPDPNRPPTSPDHIHRSVTTQAATTAVLEWPWDRPATTIAADERLSSPGHHDPNVSDSQHGPNAVILSETAAAILQGFPPGWLFSGDTKRARWSQLGQAMPPPLAEAVARAVVSQMRAAHRKAA